MSANPGNRYRRDAIRAVALALRDTFRMPQPFAERALEQRFLEQHALAFLAYRRAALLLGIALWLGLAGMDFFEHSIDPLRFDDATLRQVAAIRLLVLLAFVPVLVAALSRRFEGEHEATLLIVIGIGCAIAGVFGLVHTIPYPSNYHYFSGLFVIVIFVFTFAHLRALPALLLGLAAAALLVAWTLPSDVLGASEHAAIVLYLVVLLLCHGVGVKFERHARERFLREAELDRLVRVEQAALHEAQQLRRRADENTRLLVELKEQQRAEAERSSMQKSRFLAEAAHDLRQPMQAIGNLVDAASAALDTGDGERASELLANARAALRMMRSSFNAVLELSRLEAGATKPDYSVFDVGELLHEVATTLEPLARSLGVRIRIRIPASHRAYVRSDRSMLGRLLSNLVANAIKYSDPRKGPRRAVLVGVVCFAKRARVDVVDNGIGIPRAQWDRVFAPFYQIDNPERDRERGLGLGLSIVNAIVSLLAEHRLDLRSRPGAGTRFSVEVPLSHVQTGAPDHPPEPDEPDTFSLRGSYALLVEDDLLVRRSTEALFEQHGILFESASSLEDLRTIVASVEREPDFVVTDYRLPRGGTGEEVLRIARREFGESLPAVITTGELAPLDRVQALPGLVLLRKPVSSATLLRSVEQLLRRQDGLRDLRSPSGQLDDEFGSS